MGSRERLYELWMLYFTERGPQYLQLWIQAFVTSFERIIDVQSFQPLPRRPEEMAVEIPLLPGEVLETLSNQLRQCVRNGSVSESHGGGEGEGQSDGQGDGQSQGVSATKVGTSQAHALLLVKFLIIICRNLENIQAEGMSSIVPEIVNLLSVSVAQLKTESVAEEIPSSQPRLLVTYSLYLCECLFDPYQVWRRQLGGETISNIERMKYKFKPASLPPQFVTFFHDSLQDSEQLPEATVLRLVYLYGAVISGSKENALVSIRPPSLASLMSVLRASGRLCLPGEAPQLLQLTLKCLIGTIHVLHGSSRDQRGVDIRSILDTYFRLLNGELPSSLEGESPATENGFVTLRINMLNAISEMLNCGDRPVLQAIFLNNNCYEHIIQLIQNSKLYVSRCSKEENQQNLDLATQLLTEMNFNQVYDEGSESITVHAIAVLTAIMKNSPSAKEVFKERIGYSHLYEVLKSRGRPSKRLLQELMNMAVEGDHSMPMAGISNEQPLLLLCQWIPDLDSRDLQILLSDWLRRTCGGSRRSRETCVKSGMVSALLETLGQHSNLHPQCASNLLWLVQSLGSLSIRPGELRQLLKLLRTDSEVASERQAHPYSAQVIRALSAMARSEEASSALQYFDLTPPMAGIMVPPIQKWPGNGFAFHAWLCLDTEQPTNGNSMGKGLKRKQLYSFFTSSGTGFEAFFTTDGMLVVAVCTKKDYMTVALPEVCFTDSQWHCVDIVHTAGRRYFGQTVLSIYADGCLYKTAQLRFPSLTEPYTYCGIGSAGHRTSTTVVTPTPTQSVEMLTGSRGSLARSLSFPATLAGPPAPTPHQAIVNTLPAGSQDAEWGTPTSLQGQLGDVSVFHEALQPPQLRLLHAAGPNNVLCIKPDGELWDLSYKLLLHYTPRACSNHMCLDLSPKHLYDGRLTGHNTINWDVKDGLGCVGGMAALLPLLEQVVEGCEEREASAESTELVGPELTARQNLPGMQLPLGKSSESKLERNSVAAFLLMVKNFIHNHPVNQENLLQSHVLQSIGSLLQRVQAERLDMSVLMACQFLMEEAGSQCNVPLLHHMYQHLLLDISLWAQSDFAVRLGHIQYLSTVMKEHRQRIRKKYGVQYILDSMRKHYGSEATAMVEAKTVQISLFSLVGDFLSKSSTSEEFMSLVSFILAVSDEEQVCGALDLLLGMMRTGGTREMVSSLLLEAGNVDALYSLLLDPSYTEHVQERVLRILHKLLKWERVAERCKQRVKLREVGYQGLVSFLQDVPVSVSLVCGLFEQVMASDAVPNYKDLLAVVHLSHRAELTVRLQICRKLFHLIHSQQDVTRQLARQVGWQDILTKLYVRESYGSREPSLSGGFVGGEQARVSGKPSAPLQHADSNPDSEVFLPFHVELGSQAGDLPISPSSAQCNSIICLDSGSVSSSSNTIDIPGLARPLEDIPYHPLSPFTSSAFDPLGPEVSSGGSLPSRGSLARAESGTMTPDSACDTPSPSEPFRAFPILGAHKSSSLSNVLDETISQDNPASDDMSNTSNPQTPEEELCNVLTNLMFCVSWRGVEGGEEAAWRERGQVFSVLTKLGTACQLVRPPDEIKRSLLELMLESAFSDVKDAVSTVAGTHASNFLRLLRLLQDFLFSEGLNNRALWSEKVFEGMINLLDKLGVWYHVDNGTSDLREMAQIGLRLILGYIVQEDIQVCAMACVKLHSLLQVMPVLQREQACYLLGKLDAALGSRGGSCTEVYSYLVPIARTLLDQSYQVLQLQLHLPFLPPTNGSPTFYEDFQVFCETPEWRAFINKEVLPVMSQFEDDTFGSSHRLMSEFWNSCYDSLMNSALRREREREESRARFQEVVFQPVMKRVRYENARYYSVLKQNSTHQLSVRGHWAALRRLLTSPRGVWAYRDPPPVHWKLSTAETYTRMRFKLIPNYNFDPHHDASALRDNQGSDPLSGAAQTLPLAVAKEAKVSELGDDQLPEEDLLFLNKQAEVEEPSLKEKLVIAEDCELITIMAVVTGRLEVTNQHIYFYDGSTEKEETEEGIGYDFKRPLAHLREVHLRRYNLRRSALELFFIDQSNYFINFKKKVRNKVYSRILGTRPPNLFYFGSRSPQELLKASGLTQKWVQREISNFEYLMQLNTIAGRTYSDLSQYPVMPWILCDYTSQELELVSGTSVRDLSRPIGVVNEKHAKEVKEKYESFEDPTGAIDKFHYGTHYSNAAGVMHYLIRTEPFTTLHIQLQSGRFDCSDRQFHAVPAAWQVRVDNPVDVKELIPEFFYFPEFLENLNDLDLGCLQLTGDQVGDVVLPKWADSPEDFIYKHRRALESEFVSDHLHEWIDLIFGYKQRGPAAVEALNVFYYCTYEGAVDLDAIADETERKALEGIISNFGQTPCQLLKEAHPPRLTTENAVRRRARFDTYTLDVFEHLSHLKSFFVEGISDDIPLVQAVVPKNQAHSFITQGSPDLLVTVSVNGLIGAHGWLPYDKNISNYFTFTRDPTSASVKTQRILFGPFAPGADLSPQTLVVSHDGKLLFSAGHWDNSVQVTTLSKGKVTGHVNRHIDIVTCLAVDLCDIYLISGSRDTTCMVWQIIQQGGFACGLGPKPFQVLYGHDEEVTCVAISTELDMAVSGSKDGTVIVHTVRRGQFTRTFRPPCESSLPLTISSLAVGLEGHIVIHSTIDSRAKDNTFLHLYSVNGKLLASETLAEPVTAMCLARDHVVLGTESCSLHVRDLRSLKSAMEPLVMKVPIHCVSVTKDNSHILVGLDDGKLIVVGPGQPSEIRAGQFTRRLWSSTRRLSRLSSAESDYRK